MTHATLDLDHFLKDKRSQVNEHLNKLVPESLTSPYSTLYQAARYSLFAGGKRLRPILTLATAEVFGANPAKVLSPACALEMTHTYSLIHDDLPCMDDDDTRRGKPTLHKAFPEGQAVLAGDFLLTHAFEVLAQAPELTDVQKVRLISILSQRSGGKGMIGGQVMDLEAENRNINLETLQAIHQHKTGALISASIEFGGIIAEVQLQELKLLSEFGYTIGLAFQIIDDVLDITSSEELLGKTQNSDLNNNKSTYVSLLGVEKAEQTARDLLVSAQQMLQELPANTTLLENLADRLVNRSS